MLHGFRQNMYYTIMYYKVMDLCMVYQHDIQGDSSPKSCLQNILASVVRSVTSSQMSPQSPLMQTSATPTRSVYPPNKRTSPWLQIEAATNDETITSSIALMSFLS